MPAADVVIYVAANSQQAHLLAGKLTECGIVADVINDALFNCALRHAVHDATLRILREGLPAFGMNRHQS